MSSESGDLPRAEVDPEPERGPGGPDAVPSVEGDVGARTDDPVTPDEPLSAQMEESDLPDQLEQGERQEPPEQATDNTDVPSS